MTACGGGSSGSQAAKEPETPEEFHAAMVQRSLVSTGNTTRIRSAMEHAQAGSEVTIGYIGGSITEGHTAGAADCYARKSYEAFTAEYGTGENVDYVNAGLSGTPSVLGILRAQEDLFQYHPDVIFIEFAVNDAQDETHKIAYESLVSACLSQPQQPAVILLFTVLENGYTCQEQMQQIGEHYDLPMISVGDAINKEIADGRMTWTDYSDDESHPNVAGHELVTELITNYFTVAAATKPKTEAFPDTALFGTDYENATLLSPDALEVTDLGSYAAGSSSTRFPDGFTFQEDGAANPLCFTVTASKLFFVYKQLNSKDWGMAGVYVNGHLEGFLTGNAPNGWGGPITELLYDSDTVSELQIEIKPLTDQETLHFELFAVGAVS